MFVTFRLNHSWIHLICDKSDKMWLSLMKLIQARLLVLQITGTPSVAICGKQSSSIKVKYRLLWKLSYQLKQLLLLFSICIKWETENQTKMHAMVIKKQQHKQKHLKNNVDEMKTQREVFLPPSLLLLLPFPFCARSSKNDKVNPNVLHYLLLVYYMHPTFWVFFFPCCLSLS